MVMFPTGTGPSSRHRASGHRQMLMALPPASLLHGVQCQSAPGGQDCLYPSLGPCHDFAKPGLHQGFLGTTLRQLVDLHGCRQRFLATPRAKPKARCGKGSDVISTHVKRARTRRCSAGAKERAADHHEQLAVHGRRVVGEPAVVVPSMLLLELARSIHSGAIKFKGMGEEREERERNRGA